MPSYFQYPAPGELDRGITVNTLLLRISWLIGKKPRKLVLGRSSVYFEVQALSPARAGRAEEELLPKCGTCHGLLVAFGEGGSRYLYAAWSMVNPLHSK